MTLALASRRTALTPPWVRDDLWRRARAVPSLDLRFADNKSLVDAVTGASLVTFTRASNGTFVGSDGVLQTAVTNLLLRSEEFDNASWTKHVSTITANATTAPDGTLTADRLLETATTATFYVTHWAHATPGTYTASVFAKGDGSGRLLNMTLQQSGAYQQSYFNLATGVVSNVVGTLTASIQALANGWFRCSVTGTSDSTTTLYIYTAAAAGENSVYNVRAGSASAGIFIWGAQLEQSATVGEYIPTTSTINSAPRFDHNPITGESLGLLVEEQRTNVQLYSEQFDTWFNGTTLTVTANAGTSPSGTTTADKIIPSVVFGSHYVADLATRGSGTFSFSVYAKADGYPRFGLRVYDGTAYQIRVTFDISAGTVVLLENGTASITPVGNGWYRCSGTGTSVSGSMGATSGWVIESLPSTTTVQGSFAGDGTSGALLWGAQVETGAFPTSYIPTTTASVTRAADVASITGTNFSSWYNQSQGTIFSSSVSRRITAAAVSLGGSGPTEEISNYGLFNSTYFGVYTSATYQANINTGSVIAGQAYKQAGAYAVNNFGVSRNGEATILDTNGLVPVNITYMNIGVDRASDFVSYALNGTIARLTYWPTRLSNTTLQTLTQ